LLLKIGNVQKIIAHVETLRHTSISRVDEVFLYYRNVFYTAYHFVFLLSAKKNVFATSNASNVGFIVCMLLQFCSYNFSYWIVNDYDTGINSKR